MRIKRSSVTFNNILKLTDSCDEGHWKTMALVMRNFIIENGLYTNAPAFYQVVDVEDDASRKEYTVYVPINQSVGLGEDIPMEFISELIFDDALTFRVADPATLLEEVYLILDTCASEQGYGLVRPFYHVCFDVFGETMIDVVAPIVALPGKQPDESAAEEAVAMKTTESDHEPTE